MAELLGVGITHYPPLAGLDENMADILRWTLQDPDIPEAHRDPKAWPEEMRDEWAEDGGRAAACRHRQELVAGLRRCRAAIDDFNPDFVLIWGDDQYENFREEIIPPFCVMAWDDLDIQPFGRQRKPNVWGESAETHLKVRGRSDAAKYLTSGLLQAGFDMAYSYRPREKAPPPHAFTNSILYLDYDRVGFPYPVVPVAVNCYGRHVVSRRGGLTRFADAVPRQAADPPSPSPRRCFDMGAATAGILAASPWRVALVASSSWSHAFLNDATWRLYPDIPADRALYDALSDYEVWANVQLAQIEQSGQQELLNWFCLMGAMAELKRPPQWSTFVTTHIFNSDKCFALF